MAAFDHINHSHVTNPASGSPPITSVDDLQLEKMLRVAGIYRAALDSVLVKPFIWFTRDISRLKKQIPSWKSGIL